MVMSAVLMPDGLQISRVNAGEILDVNVWHPARVTKKQEQKRDQPEVGPENETGYHQMMGDRVTAALDAQDHGMVTRAFPTSISSPGMFPFPSPSPSLRKETTILRTEEPRDIHVVGYGSNGEGGSQSMGYR
ncbi:hypothetical protein Q8A73_018387 [Channa argus]|nr:hypothetical protein Q8A73_018387 [Channa argus]